MTRPLPAKVVSSSQTPASSPNLKTLPSVLLKHINFNSQASLFPSKKTSDSRTHQVHLLNQINVQNQVLTNTILSYSRVCRRCRNPPTSRRLFLAFPTKPKFSSHLLEECCRLPENFHDLPLKSTSRGWLTEPFIQPPHNSLDHTFFAQTTRLPLRIHFY